MIGFKAKSKDVKDFISSVKLEGTNEEGKKTSIFDDIILQVLDTGIKCEMVDENKTVFQRVRWLAKDGEGFKKLTIIGKGNIPIGNLQKLETLIGSFGPEDEVSVRTADNKLYIERKNPRKRASVALTKEEYIKSREVTDPTKFAFEAGKDDRPTVTGNVLDVKIKANASDLKQIIIDGNKVEDRSYPIKISPKKFSIRVGGDDYFIEAQIPSKIEMEGKKAESLFRVGLGNIFENIAGEVDLYLKDNGFLWVTCIDKNIRKEYMVTNAERNE